MPNRQGRRMRIGPHFDLFGQSACTYSTWLDPEEPSLPAHHTYASMPWQVVKGTGWVVYEQLYSGFWTLAYLWPGINWGALVGQNYFFLPQTRMCCEVTCFTEQKMMVSELVFEDNLPPMDVDVHLRGEVTAIGPDWIDLTNRYTTSRVPLTAEEVSNCNPLYVGMLKKILDEVELDEFLASLREAPRFDPRIIYPFRETSGTRVLSDCMLEWPAESVVPNTILQQTTGNERRFL